MPEIEFRTRERLMDGSPDPTGEVQVGQFLLRARGLEPGAILNVALIRGENRLERSVQADEQGRIRVSRTVTNQRILDVLEQIGCASWNDNGRSWKASAGEVTLMLALA